ncbi:MAG TPA: hypothetical protein VGO90_06150 [Chthoniobacteraceae bacterium]|nr:hypothetical protein [Chthoniobacteraceae bacterium]
MAPLPSPSRSVYRRIPGSGALFQRGRLWAAPDHLLLVGASLIGERYRRFYFADIQAFVVRKTLRNWIRASVALLLSITCASSGWMIDMEPVPRGIFLGLAGFFLLIVLWHVLRGPTCHFHVRTAVQFERVPSLTRIRSARRVIAHIRPLIEAAQAGTSPVAPDSEP